MKKLIGKLILAGPGRLSIDALIRRSMRG